MGFWWWRTYFRIYCTNKCTESPPAEVSVAKNCLLGGWYHRKLIVQKQRCEPSDSTKNVNIYLRADIDVLNVLEVCQSPSIEHPYVPYVMSGCPVVW